MTREDFKNLILPLGNKLYRFACRLMQNPTDAEDALQDVLVKLWKNRSKLTDCINVEAFAMRVTKNDCLDKLKAKKPLLTHADDETLYNSHQHSNDALQYTDTENQLELLKHILTKLPTTQAMILQLRDIEGYEFEDIQHITGLNLNAVRVNLCRARQTIRKQFAELNRYENT